MENERKRLENECIHLDAARLKEIMSQICPQEDITNEIIKMFYGEVDVRKVNHKVRFRQQKKAAEPILEKMLQNKYKTITFKHRISNSEDLLQNILKDKFLAQSTQYYQEVGLH